MDLSDNRKKQIDELPYDIKVKLLKKLKDAKYGTGYTVKTRISLNSLIDFYQLMADLNINKEGGLIMKCVGDAQDKIKGK